MNSKTLTFDKSLSELPIAQTGVMQEILQSGLSIVPTGEAYADRLSSQKRDKIDEKIHILNATIQ